MNGEEEEEEGKKVLPPETMANYNEMFLQQKQSVSCQTKSAKC